MAVGATLIYAANGGTTVEPGLQAAKSGVVLDADTRQPLAGVYVVARWLEQTTQPALLGQGGKVDGQCLFRVVVRTDSQGHYAIPATSGNFQSAYNLLPDRSKRYFWDLYTYSAGFGVAGRIDVHPRVTAAAGAGDSSAHETQTLEPILLATDHAPAGQRVAALADTLSRFTCEPYASEPLPIAQQVYAEGYATACLPEPNDAARALARLRNGGAMTPASADPEPPCLQFRQARNEVR
jgi:hypothetical protein